MDGPLPPGPMNGRGGPPPSPPVSIARSSNGNSLYPDGGPGGPPNGPPPGRKYNLQALEAQLADHHRVLKDYLAESLRQDKTYMPHNRARDKLLRLSPIQFQELSTDVYDELLRREDERVAQGPDSDGRNIPRFLLPKNNFHPKRNQARQKLSTLAQKKFRELATDVLFELERRFPRFTGAERVANRGGSRPPTGQGFHGMRRPSNASSIGGGMPYSPSVVDGRGTPGPRQFHSNTMVPNKGIMVEDDDASVEGDDAYDFARRSSRRTTNRSLPYSVAPDPGLQARIEELESQLNQKDKALEEEKERSTSVTSDLEKQIKNAKQLNGSLQAELDRMRVDKEADDWKEKYEELEHEYNQYRQSMDGIEQELHEHRQSREEIEQELHEHRQSREHLEQSLHEHQQSKQTLEQEFEDYRQSTEAIRSQTADSMQELRSLTDNVNRRRDAEEDLARENVELKEELESWKSRHAKTRAHLRTLKASSTGLYIQQPTAAQFLREGNVLDSQGAVKDVSVTRFQLAIDELLHLARDADAPDVLAYMRQLVASVRSITNDVSKANPRGPEDFTKRRKKLEARIASTTNNLITVSKNHAVGNGLAPASLVDAAASHLSAAVIDYIKFMKVKPSYEGKLEDREDFT